MYRVYSTVYARQVHMHTHTRTLYVKITAKTSDPNQQKSISKSCAKMLYKNIKENVCTIKMKRMGWWNVLSWITCSGIEYARKRGRENKIERKTNWMEYKLAKATTTTKTRTICCTNGNNFYRFPLNCIERWIGCRRQANCVKRNATKCRRWCMHVNGLK